jgi:NitT/TauT family transport system permease protein
MKYLYRTLTTLLVIGLWFLFTDVVSEGNPILSEMGPINTLFGIQTLFERDVLVGSIGISLYRLTLGIVISTIIGIAIGLIFGTMKTVEFSFGLVVQFLRMTSPLAWAPIAVMVFGIGTTPVVFLIILATIWPIALATAAGVRSVDKDWNKIASSLGAKPREVIRYVTFPAITSHILTGLRLAIGIGWVVLVPAEMLGVDSGLGFLILNARDQLSYDLLAATMFVIGSVGFVLDTATQSAFRRISRVR